MISSNTVAFNTNAEVVQSYPERNTASLDGAYVTAPMAAVLPVDQLSSEEELHSSFEDAISGRLIAVNNRLDRLSSMPHPIVAYAQTGSLQYSLVSTALLLQARRSTISRYLWRKIMIGAALALLFILFGFDLMGLLVLHMH